MSDTDNKVITIKDDLDPKEGGFEVTVMAPDDATVMIEHFDDATGLSTAEAATVKEIQDAIEEQDEDDEENDQTIK